MLIYSWEPKYLEKLVEKGRMTKPGSLLLFVHLSLKGRFLKTEILDVSSGEAGSRERESSPGTLISTDTILLGPREVMGSDRTAANESLDLSHAAAVNISQSVFILGEQKQTINQQYSSADSQRRAVKLNTLFRCELQL